MKDGKAGSPLLTLEDLRQVAGWSAGCAERVLPAFERVAPKDARPRGAILAARVFAQGGVRTAQLRAVAWAAHAAAREVDGPAAAAARAASAAAATAYTHPIVTSHQSKHILGASAYAILAAGDEDATREAELLRALEQASPEVRQVVQRMPARGLSKGRLGELLHRLDKELRRR